MEPRGRHKKHALVVGSLIAVAFLSGALTRGETPSDRQADWQAKLNEELPLLGHRNWILIVDSAYPLQTAPGVQTIETDANDLDVVKYVLNAIENSIHVRPVIYMDAELPFVPEQEAQGVTEYRRQIKALLGDRPVHPLLHDELIRNVNELGKTFDILILKTNLRIPYTSLFLQLNCGYWSDADEARLRKDMKKATSHRP